MFAYVFPFVYPPADMVTLETTSRWGFDFGWVSVVGRTYMNFQVKACRDAHLALEAIPGNTRTLAYLIIIGGWKNTALVVLLFLYHSQFI